MSATSRPTATGPDRATGEPRAVTVMFGFLAAPVAWIVHLVASSALVPVACELDTVLVVHLATVATAISAIAGILVARRTRSHASGPGHVMFLSIGGFWLGFLFLALILLEGLPVFVLEPCD